MAANLYINFQIDVQCSSGPESVSFNIFSSPFLVIGEGAPIGIGTQQLLPTSLANVNSSDPGVTITGTTLDLFGNVTLTFSAPAATGDMSITGRFVF